MPITFPRELIKGSPELPGFNAASGLDYIIDHSACARLQGPAKCTNLPRQ